MIVVDASVMLAAEDLDDPHSAALVSCDVLVRRGLASLPGVAPSGA